MGDTFYGANRAFPQSIHDRSPLDVAQEAARLSAISVAGGTLTPEQQGVLSFAAQRRLVEPMNFPSVVHGVPVGGQERIQQTLQNMTPALRGELLTIPGALQMIPPLPPNFPDYHLLEPPSRLSALEMPALTLEQQLELMKRARRL